MMKVSMSGLGRGSCEILQSAKKDIDDYGGK